LWATHPIFPSLLVLKHAEHMNNPLTLALIKL
jgi:hypothetical protein